MVYEDESGVRTESPFSNTVSATASLDEIFSREAISDYNVYTVDGETVISHGRDIKCIPSGIYIINNRKVVKK